MGPKQKRVPKCDPNGPQLKMDPHLRGPFLFGTPFGSHLWTLFYLEPIWVPFGDPSLGVGALGPIWAIMTACPMGRLASETLTQFLLILEAA